MEGGGLEHMVLSFAACAVAVLVGLSAFAVSGRSERASPMFVLAAPTPGAYCDFVVSILMENHGSPAGPGYVIRHNPFAYYGDIATNATRCARVVPAGIDDSALLDDLGSASSASNYMWLTPNLCNDMDACPVATGDAYLSTLVPK